MKISHGYKHDVKEKYEIPVGHVSLIPTEELVKHTRKVIRDPKVPNKYSLTWEVIKNLKLAMNQKSVNLCFGEIMLSMHGVLAGALEQMQTENSVTTMRYG